MYVTFCISFLLFYEATLRLSPGVQHPLVVDIVQRGGSFNSVWLRVQATTDEHVYGGGEQFSSLDLRGKVFPIWTREQGSELKKQYGSQSILPNVFCSKNSEKKFQH